jgi:hypothetical protein
MVRHLHYTVYILIFLFSTEIHGVTTNLEKSGNVIVIRESEKSGKVISIYSYVIHIYFLTSKWCKLHVLYVYIYLYEMQLNTTGVIQVII